MSTQDRVNEEDTPFDQAVSDLLKFLKALQDPEVSAYYLMKRNAEDLGLEVIDRRGLELVLRFFHIGIATREGNKILFVFTTKLDEIRKLEKYDYNAFSRKAFLKIYDAMKNIVAYVRNEVLANAWFGFGTVQVTDAPTAKDITQEKRGLGATRNWFARQSVWTIELQESDFMTDDGDDVFLKFETDGRIFVNLKAYLQELALLPWELETLLDSYMSIEVLGEDVGFDDPKLVFRDDNGDIVRADSLRDVPHVRHLDEGTLVSYMKTGKGSTNVFDLSNDINIPKDAEWHEVPRFGLTDRRKVVTHRVLKGEPYFT